MLLANSARTNLPPRIQVFPNTVDPGGSPSLTLTPISYFACRDDFVLLSVCFFARRNDFVGQVGRGTLWVRPIGNRPSAHHGETPAPFAAYRYTCFGAEKEIAIGI